MNISIETKTLRKALSAVVPAVPRESIIPALFCARMRLLPKQSGDEDYPQLLEICCSNLDARIAVEIPCKAYDDVKQDLLFPMKTALRLVKLFDHRETRIFSVSETEIKIASGDCEYRLYTPDPADFPEGLASANSRNQEAAGIDPKPDLSGRFAAGELTSMLRGVRYAASDGSDNRQVLESVLFECNDDSLRLVSTDGWRLAIVERKLDEPAKGSARYVVPVAAVDMLTRALATQALEHGALGVRLTNDHIIVTCGECQTVENLEFRAKLPDCEYPNYRHVIQGLEFKAWASVVRADFLRAVQRISLIAEDPAAFGMILGFDETILIRSMDRRATERIAALSFSGEKAQVRLNPRYMLDFLKAADDETIHMQAGHADHPICLTDEENRQVCYIAVISNLG